MAHRGVKGARHVPGAAPLQHLAAAGQGLAQELAGAPDRGQAAGLDHHQGAPGPVPAEPVHEHEQAAPEQGHRLGAGALAALEHVVHVGEQLGL